MPFPSLRLCILATALAIALVAALAPAAAAQTAPPDTARSAAPAGPTAPADSAARPDAEAQTDRSQPPPPNSPPPLADAPPDTVGISTVGSGALRSYDEAYYLLDSLNAGVTFDAAANLQTPQAALEYFARTSGAERFRAAAQALNLNLVPEAERAALAPLIAERLYYVLNKQIGFDWEGLPDRPDGMSDGRTVGNDPLAGQPRRSLRIGSIPVDGRDVAIRLQRVKVRDAAPVWVFSPQTVGNVDALYERYGPGPVDRMVPAWAKVQVLGQTALWAWLALLALAGVAALAALVVQRVARRRLAEVDNAWIRGFASELATPIATVAALLLLYLAATLVLALPGSVTTLLFVALIAGVTWLAMRAVNLFTDRIARDDFDNISELSSDEKTARQKQLTYLSVGRRVVFFVLFLLALGAIVGQFEKFQALGVTLMASAGVATVLLGIAAQPALGNIAAGLQIALSKPVRIGDNVLYEGNWGWVEDITYTYLLIQTWDQRRLVVPLRYFVTHPFENWTKRTAHLVKPIVLYADYSLDVDRVRERFADLLRDDDDWDEEKEPTVEVVDVDGDTMEIRALCSAKDPSTAWALHCRLRERLISFVRDLDGGQHLPRQRVELSDKRAHPDREPADERTGASG